MVRAAVTVAALTLPAACVSYEFVGPEARDAAVSIEYVTEHTDSLFIDLQVAIEVGQDEGGRANHPDDPTLMVNGAPVQPLSMSRYDYAVHLAFSQPESATLTVVLPAIGSASVTDRTINLPLPRREQAYVLTLSTLDPVTLRLRHEQAPLVNNRWRLDLATECSAPAELLGYVGAFGWPPDLIAIPEFVFAGLQSSNVAACLSINGRGFPDASGRPFTLIVQLDGRVGWRVNVGAPPTG
jgi:hypothetical protein